MTSRYSELLETGKRRGWWRRLELLMIGLVLSGGWASVGFTLGAQRDAAKDAAIVARQAATIQRLRDKQAAELERMQATCAKSMGETAKAVAGAIGEKRK